MPIGTLQSAIAVIILWPIAITVPVAYGQGIHSETSVRAEMVPAPDLVPSEVTRIQLEALRTNAPGDEGIALTYRFASPDNRRTTGPLPRFVAMVKSPPYDRLLNHRHVDFGPVEIVDGKAYQAIVVIDADGGRAGFIWIMSRQGAGEFEDCWMTDAVISTDEKPPQQLALRVLAKSFMQLQSGYSG